LENSHAMLLFGVAISTVNPSEIVASFSNVVIESRKIGEPGDRGTEDGGTEDRGSKDRGTRCGKFIIDMETENCFIIG